MNTIGNIIGKKYGRLTVLSTFKKLRKEGYHRSMANCHCECGNETITAVDKLKRGHTRSCGCYHLEQKTKHGFSNHQLYKVWEGMVERCENPHFKQYHRYGGRGIKVCEAWRNNAGEFVNWALSKAWVNGLTIERIENNGNYEPSNCTLIPFNQQQKNTSTCMRIPFNGKVYTQNALAKEFKICLTTLRYRMSKGWPLHQALNVQGGVTIGANTITQ